jgi:tetratricopeptide (TPR) repeat protein
MKLGDVADMRAEWNDALRQYESGIAMFEGIAHLRNAPSTALRLGDLVRVRIAHELVVVKRYVDAERYARRAISDFQRTLALSPGDNQARTDIADAYRALGRSLAGEQRDREALTAFEQALVSYRAVLAANPHNGDSRRELGFTLYHIGDVMLRRGLAQAALQSYAEAATFLETPDVRPQAIETLALMYLRAGDAHVLAEGASVAPPHAAILSYQKSGAAWAELIGQHPLTPEELTLEREAATKAARRR